MRKMSLELGSIRPTIKEESKMAEDSFEDEQVSEDQKIPNITKDINNKLSLRNVQNN